MLCFLLLYIQLIHLQRDINKLFLRFLLVRYILFRWIECAKSSPLSYRVGPVNYIFGLVNDLCATFNVLVYGSPHPTFLL